MSALYDYVHNHTELIFQAPSSEDIDMVFFHVRVSKAVKYEEVLSLMLAHKGYFRQPVFAYGREYSYIELGDWLGDQGRALQFMALGKSVGLFELLTPLTVLPGGALTREEAIKLAQRGMLTVVLNNVPLDGEKKPEI
jgi:hypothetical protein